MSWERTLESLFLVSSGLRPMHLFPLLIVLYSFAVINLSNEYKYMPSPVSPPRESLNLEVVLGIPDTGILEGFVEMAKGNLLRFTFMVRIEDCFTCN